MTATDPVDDVTCASEICASEICASEGAAGPAARRVHRTEAPTDDKAEDDQAIQRIMGLPRDVGWMMVSLGVLGVIIPGLPGAPFLVAGVAVLTPGGPRLLTHWARRRPSGVVHTGLKQIGRWLDDLERRYPRGR